MTCGSLGCGRKLYGGIGGNGHGLEHYQQSGHPVSVKLGTITPEGGAGTSNLPTPKARRPNPSPCKPDVFCYLCDDSKQDPDLSSHLSTFGINLQTLTKTEKSMTELQLEHNLTYDFSLTSEDGTALEPVFGPGLTGLQNLGNSCYMASVLQTLFSLKPFQERYKPGHGLQHVQSCDKLPADCLECQMYKVADGLLSGRYSHPASYKHHQGSPGVLQQPPRESLLHASPTPEFQEGVRPVTFKAVIGKGHAEFSTMRQQDSEEFLTHLLNTLRRDMHKYKQQGPGTYFPRQFL